MKRPTNRAARTCMRWANYVKELRKRRRLTRRALAEMADLCPSYITLIERDGYIPKQDKVEALAAALKADRNYFLGQAGFATPAVFNAWLKSEGLKPMALPRTRTKVAHV